MLEKHNLSSWQFNDRKHCTDFKETDNKVGECSGVILTKVFKLCVCECVFFLSIYKKNYFIKYSPVPLQPVVVVSVEEVRLGSHGSDVRMNPKKLKQSPGPSFLYPDDESLR